MEKIYHDRPQKLRIENLPQRHQTLRLLNGIRRFFEQPEGGRGRLDKEANLENLDNEEMAKPHQEQAALKERSVRVPQDRVDPDFPNRAQRQHPDKESNYNRVAVNVLLLLIYIDIRRVNIINIFFRIS
jgi:hypothetical protein